MPSPFAILATAEPNTTFAITCPAQCPGCRTMHREGTPLWKFSVPLHGCDVAEGILLTAVVDFEYRYAERIKDIKIPCVRQVLVDWGVYTNPADLIAHDNGEFRAGPTLRLLADACARLAGGDIYQTHREAERLQGDFLHDVLVAFGRDMHRLKTIADTIQAEGLEPSNSVGPYVVNGTTFYLPQVLPGDENTDEDDGLMDLFRDRMSALAGLYSVWTTILTAPPALLGGTCARCRA